MLQLKGSSLLGVDMNFVIVGADSNLYKQMNGDEEKKERKSRYLLLPSLFQAWQVITGASFGRVGAAMFLQSFCLRMN